MSARSRISVVLFASLLASLLIGCSPQVPARDAGALTASGTLATPLLLVGGERTVYAVVRVEAKSQEAQPSGPVNVALCIDTSGSMEGKAIAEARRAATDMVQSLSDGDRLAIVVFNTTVEVILPSAELDDSVRAEAMEKIAALEAVGTTDLAAGLDAALLEVQRNFTAEGINRVVLIGDGVPNHPESIPDMARHAAEIGIPITAVGLGLDYDEVLMGKIAEMSGGRFKYVKTADKLAGFLADELSRLHTVYAHNVSVKLTAGPGVRIDSVVGAPSPPSNGVAYVPIGDLARGESRDIVVRLAVTPRKADAPIELLDTLITFDDALAQDAEEGSTQLERRVYFGAFASADEAKVAAARNRKVELAAALAEAGATTLAALELSKQQQYTRARELLTKGAETARAQAKVTPSQKLEKQATDMLAVAADMPLTDPIRVPEPAATSYELNDDAMGVEAAPMPEAPMSEPQVEKRKEVHARSYEMSH